MKIDKARKRNIYIKEETQSLIESYMEAEGVETHTEAVRKIIADHCNEKLKQETDLAIKIKTIEKNVSVLTNLTVYICESMSADTKYKKNISPIYESALLDRELEIKRISSQSGLMFNE